MSIIKGHTSIFECVEASPDGKQLATGGDDNTVRVYEASTGKCLKVLGHLNAITHISWSPDGKSIASCADQVYIWGPTPRILRITKKNRPCQLYSFWSPDGKFLAVAEIYSKGLLIYETENFTKVSELRVKSMSSVMSWSACSKYIVLAVSVYGEGYKIYVAPIEMGKFTGERRFLAIYPDLLTSICCTPEGYVFIGGHADLIYIYDLKGNPIKKFEGWFDPKKFEGWFVVCDIFLYKGFIVTNHEEYLCVRDLMGNIISVFEHPHGECLGALGPYIVMSYEERVNEKEYEYAGQIVEIPFFRAIEFLSKPRSKLSDPRIHTKIFEYI